MFMGLEGALGVGILAASGLAWWQGEEAKKEAERAERRQEQAERKAELTAEAQRQADLAEKRRQENILPPIIGSQTPVSELGIAALEADETVEAKDIGVQVGTGQAVNDRGV